MNRSPREARRQCAGRDLLTSQPVSRTTKSSGQKRAAAMRSSAAMLTNSGGPSPVNFDSISDCSFEIIGMVWLAPNWAASGGQRRPQGVSGQSSSSWNLLQHGEQASFGPTAPPLARSRSSQSIVPLASARRAPAVSDEPWLLAGSLRLSHVIPSSESTERQTTCSLPAWVIDPTNAGAAVTIVPFPSFRLLCLRAARRA